MKRAILSMALLIASSTGGAVMMCTGLLCPMPRMPCCRSVGERDSDLALTTLLGRRSPTQAPTSELSRGMQDCCQVASSPKKPAGETSPRLAPDDLKTGSGQRAAQVVPDLLLMSPNLPALRPSFHQDFSDTYLRTETLRI